MLSILHPDEIRYDWKIKQVKAALFDENFFQEIEDISNMVNHDMVNWNEFWDAHWRRQAHRRTLHHLELFKETGQTPDLTLYNKSTFCY